MRFQDPATVQPESKLARTGAAWTSQVCKQDTAAEQVEKSARTRARSAARGCPTIRLTQIGREHRRQAASEVTAWPSSSARTDRADTPKTSQMFTNE